MMLTSGFVMILINNIVFLSYVRKKPSHFLRRVIESYFVKNSILHGARGIRLVFVKLLVGAKIIETLSES